MVIKLDPELEAALNSTARQQGVEPEQLALRILRERFLAPKLTREPIDDWERDLLSLATDCGVALSHEHVSSEGIYRG
jgi:hypothetical protein